MKMLRFVKQSFGRVRRWFSSPPSPVDDEMIRRETARATSDVYSKQGGL